MKPEIKEVNTKGSPTWKELEKKGRFPKREGKSPVKPVKVIKTNVEDEGYVNRVLVATPTTGLVRMEWVQARYGIIVPVNWSMVTLTQFIHSFSPIAYTVADAQNIIVKEAIDRQFEWLILVEHDNVLPENVFVMFNQYMRKERVPVVSGLYYTKARPSEPLVFRGRGTSVYDKFKRGDLVWCDGVPTGCVLIHMGILREMWKESPEYMAGDVKTRRIFETPQRLWHDPETGHVGATQGTSDLEWCSRVMRDGFLEKAGWPEYQRKKYPFLIDTNIFCRHITQDGRMYP